MEGWLYWNFFPSLFRQRELDQIRRDRPKRKKKKKKACDFPNFSPLKENTSVETRVSEIALFWDAEEGLKKWNKQKKKKKGHRWRERSIKVQFAHTAISHKKKLRWPSHCWVFFSPLPLPQLSNAKSAIWQKKTLNLAALNAKLDPPFSRGI